MASQLDVLGAALGPPVRIPIDKERFTKYVMDLWAEAGTMGYRCEGCANGQPVVFADECRLSPRPCGHHCDCSWDQDQCCFCGEVFGEHQDYPLCYASVGMGV